MAARPDPVADVVAPQLRALVERLQRDMAAVMAALPPSPPARAGPVSPTAAWDAAVADWRQREAHRMHLATIRRTGDGIPEPRPPRPPQLGPPLLGDTTCARVLFICGMLLLCFLWFI